MYNWFKRNGIHIAITAIFITLCFVYFSPAMQGKNLYQGDVLEAQAMQKEIMDIKAETGKGPLWTNSMYGGMPTYQIWVQYPNNVTTYIVSFFKTVFPNPIDTVLLYLLGAYLLFCVLGLSPWLAAAGAIAFAFSSYNFIYITAGHSNKAFAIAFFAPIIAGIFLALRGKYLLGASLMAIFLAVEIRANHVQMTYYLLIALLVLIGIELYHAIKTKTTKIFFKSISYLAVATFIAVCVNAGLLWTTYEYSKESIRGKSNLTSDKAETRTGLDKEYAYNWSQGIGEIITFLIPDAYGGGSASQSLDENSDVVKTLSEKGVPADQAIGVAKQLPTYWGEKPGTSGPWYFGAISCFLFVLGLFIVKNRIKWWVVGATVLTVLLSFGKNFPIISDLFFDYFPLYNKFRAVESILVIPSLLIPILALLAVKEVVSGKTDAKKLQKQLFYSIYITGGIVLVILVVPTLLFSFKSSGDEQLLQQLTQYYGDQTFASSIVNALIDDRISLARSDAFRSLIFILISAGIIWGLIKQNINKQAAFIGLAVIILVDMWPVDRRYLNNQNFVEESQLKQQFQPREVDQLILRDNSLNYRVLDLSRPDPFFNASASYFHKSVGGRNSARLQRFQEVIERQFTGSINQDVLDMLNTKYVITANEKNQSQKIQNRSTAAGHAWFVQNVTYVKSADEEMAAINSFDPKKEAIVHEEFKPLIDEKKIGPTKSASIELTNYRPDHLTYEYSAGNDVLAVFSEIWYDKGWNAYVDGENIPHFRADYILRAAQLPGGNHKLEFIFEPKSYYTGEIISLIASIVLGLGLLLVVWMELNTKRPAHNSLTPTLSRGEGAKVAVKGTGVGSKGRR